AIFGAPVAHENDAERALRAALDMMSEVDDMPEAISLHIGINSGEVVAGKIGSDLKMEYTVMGDTVNLAERLTSAAPSGEIYVSPASRRLTRYLFDFEQVGPLDLKGRKEKTIAYTLKGLKKTPEKFRGVPGLKPHFLGRDEELDVLRKNLDAVKQGSSCVIFVLGEAGVGKSRLVREFKNSFAKGVNWLEGRCSSYGTAAHFFPFIHVLREALLGNSQPKEKESTSRMVEKIRTLFPHRWKDVAAPIARLFPYRLEGELNDTTKYLDPRTLRLRTFVAIRDLLEALSRETPLVIALDDLHWADESSLDLIQFIIETTTSSPIMTIGVTRPVQGSKWEKIRRETARKLPAKTVLMNLKRLPRAQTEELLDLLLEKPAIDEKTRGGILTKCGGSPFYLEEILKDLIDGDILARSKGGWTCTVDDAQLSIPETVEAVIASRIDKLRPEARYILKCASVLGANFSLDDLRCAAMSQNSFDEVIGELTGTELIMRAQGTEKEYQFGHPLIQDVAYGSILKSSRKELHLRAANCIERNRRESLDHHLGVLGMHYEIGGEPSRAFSFYLRAGRRAKSTFANSEAITNFSKALNVSGQLRDKEALMTDIITAIVDRARVLRLKGETVSALTEFNEALRLSREVNDERGEADALLGLSQLYGWTSRFPEMAKASEQALELFRALNDKEGEANSLSQLAYSKLISGDYEGGISLYERSLDMSIAIDNKLEQSNCLNNLGSAYCSQGDMERGLRNFQRSLEINREIGDLEAEAANLHNIGVIQFSLGNNSEALKLFTASLEQKVRIGDRAGAAVTMNSIGTVYIAMGEYEKGSDCCLKALKAREEVHDRRGQAYTLQNISRILSMVGPLDDAVKTLKRSLKIMKDVNDREGQASVLTKLARLDIDTGNYGSARKHLDEAASIAAEIGAAHVLLRAKSELALLSMLESSVEDAETWTDGAKHLANEIDTPEARAMALWLDACLSAKKRRIGEAQNAFAEAEAREKEGGDEAASARRRYHLAGLLQKAGASAEARRHFLASRKVFERLGARLWLERLIDQKD
ncbi:MAG: tetratricopeptide repeat protein, partial [bacterium]